MADIFNRSFDEFLSQYSEYRIENDRVLKTDRDRLKTLQKSVDAQEETLSMAKDRVSSLKDEISSIKQRRALILTSSKLTKQAQMELQQLKEEESDLSSEILGLTTSIEEVQSAMVDQQEALNLLRDRETEALEKNEELMDNMRGFSTAIGVGVGFLVNAFVQMEGTTSEISDNLGVSYETSIRFNRSAYEVLETTRLHGVEMSDILRTQQAIFEVEGNLSEITKERLQSTSLIAEKLNISAKTVAETQDLFSDLSGISAETSANLVAALGKIADDTGLSAAGVMEDIAANAQTAAKYFADNPVQLAKAAIEAKRLQLSLSDMDSLASSLLDIESSIESEFQAQALTGRQMNLDRARFLALEGDIAGATSEVLSIVGDISDFNQMNIIQRQAIADAAGLELSQLIESIDRQRALSELTSTQRQEYQFLTDQLNEQKSIRGEDLLLQMRSQSTQERFQASLAQTQTTFQNALLPLMETFNSLTRDNVNLVGDMLTAYVSLVAAKKTFTALQALSKANAAIETAQTFKQAVFEMGKSIFKSFSRVPVIGAVLAGAALFGAIKMLRSQAATPVDDVMITPDQTVVTGPAGTFSLNKDDTVVAGTNLSGGGTTNSNNEALVSKLEELISIVRSGKVIMIDGVKVGQAIQLSNVTGVS